MGDTLKTFGGHSDWISCLSVLGDGTFLSASDDGTIKQWSIDTGACLNTFGGHSDWIHCLSVLADGTFLSGSFDGTIKQWSTSLFRERENTKKRKELVMSELEEFAFLPPCGDFPGGPLFQEAEKAWLCKTK